MKRIIIASSFVLFGLFAMPGTARADGCYLCGSGSSEACKNYCRYSGSDTFENRKICQARGCKVSGTSSCPTAVNYKVCFTPVQRDVVPAAWLR